VRRAGAGSAATKPHPAAAPRHEVRGEQRGKAWGGVALPAVEGAAERARVGGGEGVSTSRRGGREPAGGSGGAGERGPWRRRRREEEGVGVRVWRGRGWVGFI
jgi:hypothetical protein